MTYAGARGEPWRQMTDLLPFHLPAGMPPPRFERPAVWRSQALTKSQDLPAKTDFRLRVANALWGQKPITFQPEFLDLLAKNYGAGLRLVDFLTDPEPARQSINQWVADQTEQKIKDLLPQGSIAGLTRLVLTNAIYFNASWLHPFDENLTKPMSFTAWMAARWTRK